MKLYKRLRFAATIILVFLLSLVSVSIGIDAVSAEVKLVYASGELAGFSLSDSGPIVVGFDDTKDNISPAEKAGIELGDVIIAIDGVKTSTIDQIKTRLVCGGDTITVTCLRGGESMDIQVTLGESKALGCWLKGTFTGIGTVTCYIPDDNRIILLGHSVSDGGSIIPHAESGSIYLAYFMSIKVGQIDNPGEIRACFDYSAPTIAKITSNTKSGLNAKPNSNIEEYLSLTKTQLLDKHEVKVGKATILCEIDGNGPKEYEITIESISINKDEKNMVIHIVDKELLCITGGIVQGMSGSPIIQDGKLVGAVTHVLVNDPTRGYGIFIENMLDAAG